MKSILAIIVLNLVILVNDITIQNIEYKIVAGKKIIYRDANWMDFSYLLAKFNV